MKTILNTAKQIMEAVDNGLKVYYTNEHNRVIKDEDGEYLIYCHLNDYWISLTWKDGKTLKGAPEDFYIKKIQ